ncbi:MAG: TolB-like translocation protein, partial [Planctomycetota bacterium]
MLLAAPAALAQTPDKRPLDHGAYDRWSRITAERLSGDGRWVLFSTTPAKRRADSTLTIRRVDGSESWSVVRGATAAFTHDATHAAYLIKPDPELVKKARKEGQKTRKKGNDHLPKDTLEILELPSGKSVSVSRVKSYKLPEKAGAWLAYLMEKPLEPETPAEGAKKEQPEATEEPTAAEPAAEPPPTEPAPESKEQAAEGDEKKKQEKKKDPGTELVLRRLATGAEYRFADVTAYAFAEDGSRLIFATSAEAPEGDGVFVVTPGTEELVPLLTGRGHYKSLAVDESGQHVAFLSDRDDYEAEKPEWTLYHWTSGMETAEAVAAAGHDGIPEGWIVSHKRAPSFSENGARLFFGTRPAPKEKEKEKDHGEDEEGEQKKKEAEEEKDDDEPEVKLDIWHWQDPLLQPMQLVQAQRERERDYLAVVDLKRDRIVQLEDEQLRNVTVGSDGDADVAVGHSQLPYRLLISWDSPSYFDVYLVDVRTGKRTLVRERLQGRASLSPGAKYLTWWDRDELHWYAMSVKARKPVNLTELLPHPVHNELHDTPATPGSYGSAGWVADDVGFIVYDRNDLWLTNPSGFFPPTCITDGRGREADLRLRYVRLDPEEDAIAAEEPILLSAFDLNTKASGFYRDVVRGTAEPERLVMLDERLSTPRKADDAEALLLTRQTFERFPDLWI